MKKRTPAISLLLTLIVSLPPLAMATDLEPPPRGSGADPVPQRESSAKEEQDVRALDRQILLELVKLAQFNVRYQQTVNHYANWRKIVYPLGQEAGYACFLGYTATDITQRGRAWSNPAVYSAPSVKRGLSSAMVGTLLGGASSGLELVLDGAETLRANRNGFSVHGSVAYVQSQVKQVDEMLARRERLMSEYKFTGRRLELLDLKEKLLKYERDRLVYEFEKWSSHSRGFAWYKNSFYVINASVNFLRFAATIVGFKAFTNTRYSGVTGPLVITSSAIAATGPFASSAIGNYVSRHHMRFLAENLGNRRFYSDEEAKKHFQRLSQLLAEGASSDEHSQIASELVNLRQERVGLDNLIDHEERNIMRLRRVVGQQVISAPVVSALGTNSGILSTIAYQSYRQDAVTKNKLNLAGDAGVLVAEGIALIATPAAALAAFRYEHSLKKKGEHPEQLLRQRARDLDALSRLIQEFPK